MRTANDAVGNRVPWRGIGNEFMPAFHADMPIWQATSTDPEQPDTPQPSSAAAPACPHAVADSAKLGGNRLRMPNQDYVA
jgi:hypothetical protein